MTPELLSFIKAVNIARERKVAIESLTLKDLMDFLQDSEDSSEEIVTDATGYKPEQAFSSYKARSLDGSLTAIDLSTCDLVQYNASNNTIDVVWPHTSVQFTTNKDADGPARVSKEEFSNLLNFIAR